MDLVGQLHHQASLSGAQQFRRIVDRHAARASSVVLYLNMSRILVRDVTPIQPVKATMM